jgi:hypothetical protein
MENLTYLATAPTAELAQAATKGEIKFTQLKPRKARKGELAYTSGHRSTGYRATGVKVRGGNGQNAAPIGA